MWVALARYCLAPKDLLIGPLIGTTAHMVFNAEIHNVDVLIRENLATHRTFLQMGGLKPSGRGYRIG
jgi:hypothetical protein